MNIECPHCDAETAVQFLNDSGVRFTRTPPDGQDVVLFCPVCKREIGDSFYSGAVAIREAIAPYLIIDTDGLVCASCGADFPAGTTVAINAYVTYDYSLATEERVQTDKRMSNCEAVCPECRHYNFLSLREEDGELLARRVG